MINKKFLVIGATGHVGSKIAILLADRGYNVTAMVRQTGTKIRDPYSGEIKYVTGDLSDEESIRNAVRGMDVVISTANGIFPQKKGDKAKSVNDSALNLITICENSGVSRFVQSSTPTFKGDENVPELKGKRLLEKRLANSSMQTIIIRNAAFMDVFLVTGGFRQAEDRSYHATTKRNYGFGQLFFSMVGNFVVKRGWFMAPGGADHGTPIIATRDVAEMIVGGALYEGKENLLVEAGGPEWLTGGEIAAIIAKKLGKKKVRVIPMPAWTARLLQIIASPFSAPAASMFALTGFVASFQPRWENRVDVLRKLNLPKQLTVAEYLELNYQK